MCLPESINIVTICNLEEDICDTTKLVVLDLKLNAIFKHWFNQVKVFSQYLLIIRAILASIEQVNIPIFEGLQIHFGLLFSDLTKKANQMCFFLQISNKSGYLIVELHFSKQVDWKLPPNYE